MRKWVLLMLLFSFSASTVFADTTLTYRYDANGNLVQGEGKYYEYNDANQLIKVRHGDQNGAAIAEYAYDYTGRRVKKIEDGVTTYYVGKHFENQTGGSTPGNTSYYFANGERVAKKLPSGSVVFYQPDHLGGTNVVTNSSGTLIEKTKYYPFGEIREGGDEKYTYTGKEKDKSTDSYYYEARYYNPTFKHFTQADTAKPNLSDPQSLNKYAYVRNNPLKYIDPTGHVWWNPLTWFKKSNSASATAKPKVNTPESGSCTSVVCRSNDPAAGVKPTYIRDGSEDIRVWKKAELVQALKVEKFHKDFTYSNVLGDEPSFNPRGALEVPDVPQDENVPISAVNNAMAPYYLMSVNKEIVQNADRIISEGGIGAADQRIQGIRERYDPNYGK